MSDMRDRLIELLKEILPTRGNASGIPIIQKWDYVATADKLLTNGVILLPCKVGDKVYYVHETYWDKDYKNRVLNENVKKRILKIVERKNHATNLALEVLRFDDCFITNWVRGDIFLTKEEAEQALKERESGD